MEKQWLIGLDLGTTSVKACLFDRSGNLKHAVEGMITSHYPKQGYVEQSPHEIEQLALDVIRKLMLKACVQANEIIALSFSAAMHSLILLNELGEPVTEAMIWADGRASKQADALDMQLKQQLYQLTGTPLHPMSPFLKLMWMKEEQYAPYKQAAYMMSIKEYLIYRWTGERIVDYAIASATGLFNPSEMCWEEQCLQLVGITKEQLSQVVAPTTILPPLASSVCAATGLANDMPVIIGSADGQYSNLGIGAIAPGEMAVSVGTSGAIRQFVNRVKLSDSQSTFCYAFTEDRYIVGGPTNNGGVVVQWLKQMLQDERDMSLFLAEAMQADPGSDGLLFLPYLNGERAPLWNQHATGSFHGLTMIHQKRHFIRAVLEGITFNLLQIHRSLQSDNEAIGRLYVNGGLARSPIWLQMMADVFNAEIYVSENHHGAAWGAAWTALVALQLEPSFEAIKHNIPMTEPTRPNPAAVKQYEIIYEKYEQLVSTIKPLYL